MKNVGRARTQGLQVSGKFSLPGAVEARVAYSYLEADDLTAGTRLLRRPKHSGSVAADGVSGRFTYGAAIAYTSERTDTNFDIIPSALVKLDPYWLANARIAYKIADPVEVHLRVANAFDDDYQDVFGYRTEGRSIHAGVRFAIGG